MLIMIDKYDIYKSYNIFNRIVRHIFQTLGGERWFVNKLELEINTADKHFEHIKTDGKSFWCGYYKLI